MIPINHNYKKFISGFKQNLLQVAVSEKLLARSRSHFSAEQSVKTTEDFENTEMQNVEFSFGKVLKSW